MKLKNIGIIIIVLVSIMALGCVEDKASVAQIDSSKPKLSTVEPSMLALQLSDLPSNFTIKERTERIGSDVLQEARDLGWEEGYYVRFVKIGDNIFDATIVRHSISIYPSENISKIIDIPMVSDSNRTYDELSKPNIGDNSRAFRITTEDDNRYYEIEFVKMDVYENIQMSGTTTDYELLKELAKKAEEKIK